MPCGLRTEVRFAYFLRVNGILSLEGPDFLGAEIEIAGSTVLGDVEIHFRSSDWRAHGHHENPSFERVVLHVILFPLSDHENRNPAIT